MMWCRSVRRWFPIMGGLGRDSLAIVSNFQLTEERKSVDRGDLQVVTRLASWASTAGRFDAPRGWNSENLSKT